ncbi:isopeptide-forming domain-containing fimbrial protein [Frisingicoccus sp.]|uniref:isopeptide-forming domain-containing fimbrial protein n=1 Tax=Frisingicoccus sp. TaxID=1918627 RepID=UPI00399AD093
MKQVMKQKQKIVCLLLALVMAFAMAVTAFADGTGTITIENATDGNTYKIYKVFEANGNGTNIVYTLVEGKSTVPAGFKKDVNGYITYDGSGTDGQLTADDIEAIKGYVTEADLIGTVKATGTTVTVENLPNGYYYITTTTGTAVTITSTNRDATVKDKNEAPVLDKKITGVGDGSFDADGKKALAEVGTKVTYTATIEVKKGAVGYVFHDKMDAGLKYNEDVAVSIEGSSVDEANYDDTLAAGDTITLSFKDDWIKNQIDKTITITYTATVTSDALTEVPAQNTATVDYGHNGYTNHTDEKKTETYNAKFTVTKTDDQKQPLKGAGFVLAKDTNGSSVYYKVTDNDITWVPKIEDATELMTTEASNVIAFTGLADGSYTLIEKTVPAGYNKAKDETFTIVAHNYEAANLIQAATVINKAGSLLPSTGGMGTTLFYIIGSILVVGAAILLVAKKRMSDDK